MQSEGLAGLWYQPTTLGRMRRLMSVGFTLLILLILTCTVLFFRYLDNQIWCQRTASIVNANIAHGDGLSHELAGAYIARCF